MPNTGIRRWSDSHSTHRAGHAASTRSAVSAGMSITRPARAAPRARAVTATPPAGTRAAGARARWPGAAASRRRARRRTPAAAWSRASGRRASPDAAAHGRPGRLEEVHRVGPVAQEDRAPVAEVAPAQLLVGRGHPRWAHAGDDQRAQERQPAGRALFLREDGAVGAEHARAVGPDRLQGVDGEPLVLPALPDDAVQFGVSLGAAHAHDLVDERLPGPRDRKSVV